jgi:tRNA pseudouridine32 synthase/23S rRNA pseudouridine746 synthase/23S rRNA pseudouridine1911/1915/1917 synthase
MTSIDLASRILHQDANLIILDKPAGLAVHGGPRTACHLEGMLADLQFSLREAPRLAHRLDRDTSGCLVLARHDKALSRLGRLFAAGRVEKTYWAVVHGAPETEAGRIDMPLVKVTGRHGWSVATAADGRPAVTDWRIRGRSDGLTWLELLPKSGRTHQIRVHCASGLGCPVVGDAVYGAPGGPALHLLSRAVAIPYWADRPPLRATADPPPHMLAALRSCGWRPGTA